MGLLRTHRTNALPPGALRPGALRTHRTNALPPGALRPGALRTHRTNALPPGALRPGALRTHRTNALPPGALRPGALRTHRTNALPPGALRPGALRADRLGVLRTHRVRQPWTRRTGILPIARAGRAGRAGRAVLRWQRPAAGHAAGLPAIATSGRIPAIIDGRLRWLMLRRRIPGISLRDRSEGWLTTQSLAGAQRVQPVLRGIKSPLQFRVAQICPAPRTARHEQHE